MSLTVTGSLSRNCSEESMQRNQLDNERSDSCIRVAAVHTSPVTPLRRWFSHWSSSYNGITSGRVEQYADCHVPNFQHTACKRSWGCTIAVRNMSSHQLLWINCIIKHCVSSWFTFILQDDTRFAQYQVAFLKQRGTANWQVEDKGKMEHK